MRNRFVPVKNVGRLTAAIGQLERRGAAEKQIVLATGEAGLGKSRTATWWALQKGALQLMCKPTMTVGWLLRDLCKELGRPAPTRVADAFDQALAGLIEKPRPIVIDEVEDVMAGDAAPLDAVRKLADLVEVPLVLVGRERTYQKIARHPQFATRAIAIAEFRPLDVSDVGLVLAELVEGEVGNDVVAEAHRASGGYIREVMVAAAEIDARARRLKRRVALADLAGRPLAGPLAAGARKANVVPFRAGEGKVADG